MEWCVKCGWDAVQVYSGRESEAMIGVVSGRTFEWTSECSNCEAFLAVLVDRSRKGCFTSLPRRTYANAHVLAGLPMNACWI